MNGQSDPHNRAMEFAEKAAIAKFKGEFSIANELFRKAFTLEKEAAHDCLFGDDELTKAVLFRSAASLAYECGEFREAERLVAIGLSGNPPDEIAEEIRNLFEEITFGRHLETKGIYLEPNEFQFSLSGKSASFGIIATDLFINRVTSLKNLIYRTFDRKNGKPYRDGGPSLFEKSYPIFLQAVRAQSFAITVRIGKPSETILPGFEDSIQSTDVIKEVFDCIEIINNRDDEIIKQRIPDPAYYNNFIGLMDNIAPDGEDVRTVGFTTTEKGFQRKVAFIRKQDEISDIHKLIIDKLTPLKKGKFLSRTGRLLFADELQSLGGNGTIKLLGDDNKKYTIIVPEGMDDIVSQLWGQTVLVSGNQLGNRLYLQSIKKNDK
jgi:hypothetical protein